jgi:cytidine deaminase
MAERLDSYIWTPSPREIQDERDFIRSEIVNIGEEKIMDMVVNAQAARVNAYTPYFKYPVGAAVYTTEGRIFSGCNSENIAASPTTHAEGMAIAEASKWIDNKSNRRFIRAVAVVHDGDSGPCGECLQRIVEHTDNCLIIVADPDGKIRRITSLKATFPYNFNPSHLGH